MRNPILRPALAAVAAVVVTAGAFLASDRSDAEPATLAAAPLAHMVFFTLADRNPENARKLAAGCQKYLTGHEGTLYFSVGTREESLDRDVNVKDFDVALHLVFESKAAQDRYQEHPRHLEFIAENKELWSEVRVFDSSLIESSSTGESAAN